jgi:hypothetical protein
VSGLHEGLRVCEMCLKAGDIDARLAQYADELKEEAKATRALIGRVQVPSYSEWRTHNERYGVASFARRMMDGSDDVRQAEFEDHA